MKTGKEIKDANGREFLPHDDISWSLSARPFASASKQKDSEKAWKAGKP